MSHQENERLTLNTNVYVILRLLSLSCIFVGFGEGVYISKECQLYCSDKTQQGRELTICFAAGASRSEGSSISKVKDLLTKGF
jgi:hypothetical protein